MDSMGAERRAESPSSSLRSAPLAGHRVCGSRGRPRQPHTERLSWRADPGFVCPVRFAMHVPFNHDSHSVLQPISD